MPASLHALLAAVVLLAMSGCSQRPETSSGPEPRPSAEGGTRSATRTSTYDSTQTTSAPELATESPTGDFTFELPHLIYPIGYWLDNTSPNPAAVAIGDVTRDGRNDVVLVTLDSGSDLDTDHKVVVFRQDTSGQLQAPRFYPYSDGLYGNVDNYLDAAIALEDMDHDGFKDIVVGYGRGIAMLLSGSNGFRTKKFLMPSDMTGRVVRHMLVLDIDSDGNNDVLAFNIYGGGAAFYGDGKGGVRAIEPVLAGVAGITDAKAVDFDEDGATDIVLLLGFRPEGKVLIIPNPGVSTAWDVSSFQLPWDENYRGIAVGDWAGDARMDIAVSVSRNHWVGQSLPAGIRLFEQNPSGGLDMGSPVVIPTLDVPYALVTVDLDRDRQADLLIDHPGWDISFLLKDGANLAPDRIVNYGGIGSEGNSSQIIAAGDITSDGCSDIVRAERWVTIMVYHGKNCRRTIPAPSRPLPPGRK